MTSFEIGLLVFACVFGGALVGMFLGRVLPPHHLGDETKSVVTLASGTLSVLSALVIGLLISYAKGDFDAQTKLVQKFAADLILLDRVMRQYGEQTWESLREGQHAIAGSVERAAQGVQHSRKADVQFGNPKEWLVVLPARMNGRISASTR